MKIKTTPITDEMIKQLKEELWCHNLRVNVKKNKQQYAGGGINITATKKNGYTFSPMECKLVANTMNHLNMNCRVGVNMLDYIGNPEKLHLFYSHGFNFVTCEVEVL